MTVMKMPFKMAIDHVKDANRINFKGGITNIKNIIVLFEVKPTKEGMKRYLDLAAMLKPLLSGFEGFIRAERFSSLTEEGKLLSMNIWTNESAVERWRNMTHTV